MAAVFQYFSLIFEVWKWGQTPGSWSGPLQMTHSHVRSSVYMLHCEGKRRKAREINTCDPSAICDCRTSRRGIADLFIILAFVACRDTEWFESPYILFFLFFAAHLLLPHFQISISHFRLAFTYFFPLFLISFSISFYHASCWFSCVEKHVTSRLHS